MTATDRTHISLFAGEHPVKQLLAGLPHRHGARYINTTAAEKRSLRDQEDAGSRYMRAVLRRIHISVGVHGGNPRK
jgi:hypothetical protein